jgi:hypothetical protein
MEVLKVVPADALGGLFAATFKVQVPPTLIFTPEHVLSLRTKFTGSDRLALQPVAPRPPVFVMVTA